MRPLLGAGPEACPRRGLWRLRHSRHRPAVAGCGEGAAPGPARAGRDAVGRCPGGRARARPASRRPRRPVRDALHLRNDRPSQRLHPHPRDGDEHGRHHGAVGRQRHQDNVILGTLPLFHVTGMQCSMNVADLPRRHQRADEPLGPRHGSAADPALPGGGLDQHRDHGHRLPGQPESGQLRPVQPDAHRRRRRRHAGSGRAAPQGPHRARLHRGLRPVRDHRARPTSTRTQRPKKQCLGIPVCNTDATSDQPGHARGARPRTGRRDRLQRAADLQGLLEEPRGDRGLLHRRWRASRSSAPATSAATTRTATSSSSTASSA